MRRTSSAAKTPSDSATKSAVVIGRGSSTFVARKRQATLSSWKLTPVQDLTPAWTWTAGSARRDRTSKRSTRESRRLVRAAFETLDAPRRARRGARAREMMHASSARARVEAWTRRRAEVAVEEVERALHRRLAQSEGLGELAVPSVDLLPPVGRHAVALHRGHVVVGDDGVVALGGRHGREAGPHDLGAQKLAGDVVAAGGARGAPGGPGLGGRGAVELHIIGHGTRTLHKYRSKLPAIARDGARFAKLKALHGQKILSRQLPLARLKVRSRRNRREGGRRGQT